MPDRINSTPLDRLATDRVTDQAIDRAIYLDHHATTPLDPRVLEAMLPYFTEHFGNPSSADSTYGGIADRAVKAARDQVASLLGADPREVIFTSGATESLNFAIQGRVAAIAKTSARRPHIACTAVEHHAVLDTCRALARQNRVRLTEIPVDRQAKIDLDRLDVLCRDDLDLLCIMAANNEVGTIYPIADIAAIAHRHGVTYVCDAAQAAGKVAIHYSTWSIDLLSISAHKFYGPKGIGALICRRSCEIEPLFYGGGQQFNRRSGTLNVPAIVGLGEACRLRQIEMETDEMRIATLRDHLQATLKDAIPHLEVNGDLDHRLAGNLHMAIPGLPNSAIVARLSDRVALSTGSACSSGVEAPSHVLQAMGLKQEALDSALRLGLGRTTTRAEVDRVAYDLIREITTVSRLLAL
jgi:cysteine desulfurase